MRQNPDPHDADGSGCASAGDRVSHEPAARRGFLCKFSAVLAGAVAALVPLASGLAVFWDPVRRGRRQGQAGEPRFLPIATVAAVPDDGVPRQFPVIADVSNAWTRAPESRIGAVYLRRKPGASTVEAFSAICPHAGCFVAYTPGDNAYHCPCHTSAFTVDGQVIAPSPSPRGLDTLETKVTDRGEILVAYVNFYSGRHEKIEKR